MEGGEKSALPEPCGVGGTHERYRQKRAQRANSEHLRMTRRIRRCSKNCMSSSGSTAMVICGMAAASTCAARRGHGGRKSRERDDLFAQQVSVNCVRLGKLNLRECSEALLPIFSEPWYVRDYNGAWKNKCPFGVQRTSSLVEFTAIRRNRFKPVLQQALIK